MKTIYLLMIGAAVFLASCRTKEGEPGAAGESSLNKQGSVSGSITYVKRNGDPITVPFNYECYESMTETTFAFNGFDYEADFGRRSANDYNNYIGFFGIDGSKSQNGGFTAPDGFSFNFSTVQNVNNELFEFSGNFYAGDAASDFTITNFSLDTLTGRMVFDFESVFDPSDIDYSSKYDDATPCTVKGHVDVSLIRRKYINAL